MTGASSARRPTCRPEQVQGAQDVTASDQYSLGVVAYEMITGEKPYTGEHLTTVVYKIVAEEPPLPNRLNPSLGTAVDAVIRKGLAKKPDARYPNCQEYIAALESACAATKGWKAMARGGTLNEPTIAESGNLSGALAAPGRSRPLPPAAAAWTTAAPSSASRSASPAS